MKISINVKTDKRDSYSLSESQSHKLITIPSVVSDDLDSSAVSNDIQFIFKTHHLDFTDIGLDFLNLGIAVYTIDQLVSRDYYGYIQWNRNLSVHLPVYNLTKWKAVQKELEQTFSFLSGDKWEFKFRKRVKYNKKNNFSKNDLGIQGVSLFSGGLDSFIGVIDLLETSRIAVVGHHKKVKGW